MRAIAGAVPSSSVNEGDASAARSAKSRAAGQSVMSIAFGCTIEAGPGERSELEHRLAVHLEGLPAGGQQVQRGAVLDERLRRRGRVVDQVLAVVEDQQELPIP